MPEYETAIVRFHTGKTRPLVWAYLLVLIMW